MLKITPQFTANKIGFRSNIQEDKKQDNIQDSQTLQQTMPVSTPDYAVKTPIKYQKLGEIKFPANTNATLYKLANGQRIVIIPREGKTVLHLLPGSDPIRPVS